MTQRNLGGDGFGQQRFFAIYKATNVAVSAQQIPTVAPADECLLTTAVQLAASVLHYP